jgi:hypothetical protein
MKTRLIACLLCFVAITSFSQESEKKSEPTDSKDAGLKRITTKSGFGNQNIKVDLDEMELERSIEVAIKEAMESLRELENLQIHIEPIEINLKSLDLDLNPIRIKIPQLEVNLEPLDLNLDAMDFDFDLDLDRDWDDDQDDEEDFELLNKNEDRNEKLKRLKDKSDKSTKEEKDKAKGLKKIN